jgi:hypothetical protein
VGVIIAIVGLSLFGLAVLVSIYRKEKGKKDQIQEEADDDADERTLHDPREETSVSKRKEAIYHDPFASSTSSDHVGTASSDRCHDTMTSTHPANLSPLGVNPEDAIRPAA